MGRLQQLARQGLLLLVLLIARGARAEGDAPQRSVEIVLVGKLGQDAVFAARITSWFPVERFSVKVRRARYLDPRQVLAPSSDTDVRVWVTLSGDNVARLYFSSSAQASGASYFLRDLRLESGLDEIGAEHISEVLHLSTQAFLDGQAHSARAELEKTLQAEPQPAPAPARVPPRPSAPAPPQPHGASGAPGSAMGSATAPTRASGMGLALAWQPRSLRDSVYGSTFRVRCPKNANSTPSSCALVACRFSSPRSCASS